MTDRNRHGRAGSPKSAGKEYLSLILILAALGCGCFCVSPAAADVTHDLKVTLSSEVFAFPKSAKGEQEDAAAAAQIKPDLALDFGGPLYAVIAPRLRAGLTDPEYHLVSLDDIYLEYVTQKLEFRMGYQTFFWGTVESVNIVDVLNQEDYIGDFLDPDKLGEPSIRVRFILGKSRFDLFHFPYFTPAPLPGKVNRFNFTDGALDVSEDPVYTTGAERLRQQFAIRWERSIGPSDVGISYFNGYEKFPVLNTPPGGPELIPIYYEMQQVGADLQMSRGNWLIKGEALYQNTAIAGSVIRQTVRPDGSVVSIDHVPDDHLAWVAGMEYTLYGIAGKSDLGLLAEYLFDTEQDLNAVAFRPYQNDLFAGMRWSRNNPGEGELLGGVFVDMKKGSQVLRVEYTERYLERIKLKAGIDIIHAASGDPITVFNNDDRFALKLSYTY